MVLKEWKTYLVVLLVFVILFFGSNYFIDLQAQKRAAKYNVSLLSGPEITLHEMENENPFNFKNNKYKQNNYSSNSYNTNEEVNFKLHPFNINLVSAEEMDAMGFPDKLKNNIVNFRNHGGKFFKAEQVKKIFAFKEEWYPDFEKNMVFEKSIYPNKFENKTFENKKIATLEINSATLQQLDNEWGISPKTAEMIIKFRDKLGGFSSVEQIKEVYTLQDSVFQHNKSHWVVNPNFIKKININTATSQELYGHPYIRKAGNAIVKYRESHGNFKNINELNNIMTISKVDFEKMKPFITIN